MALRQINLHESPVLLFLLVFASNTQTAFNLFATTKGHAEFASPSALGYKMDGYSLDYSNIKASFFWKDEWGCRYFYKTAGRNEGKVKLLKLVSVNLSQKFDFGAGKMQDNFYTSVEYYLLRDSIFFPVKKISKENIWLL